MEIVEVLTVNSKNCNNYIKIKRKVCNIVIILLVRLNGFNNIVGVYWMKMLYKEGFGCPSNLL
uniref:CSON014346 protein n=1 Tax=Culicoides sonorensis TaxID=179676 RepID=A0A336MD43_CULSO